MNSGPISAKFQIINSTKNGGPTWSGWPMGVSEYGATQTMNMAPSQIQIQLPTNHSHDMLSPLCSIGLLEKTQIRPA